MLQFYEALRLQNHTSAVLSTHSIDNTSSDHHCIVFVLLCCLCWALLLCCLCWALLWWCCDDLCPLVTLVAPVGSSSSQLWPHRDQSCHVASPVNLPSHQPALCFVSAGPRSGHLTSAHPLCNSGHQSHYLHHHHLIYNIIILST